jgi:hypothetical protein
METPTMMETLSHDNIHAYTPHQCFYLSPFDINNKGYLPLGLIPMSTCLFSLSPSIYILHMINLFPFVINGKGIFPSGAAPLTEMSLGILPLNELFLKLIYQLELSYLWCFLLYI